LYAEAPEVATAKNARRREQDAAESKVNALFMTKTVKAMLLRATRLTVTSFTKFDPPTALTPTGFFDQSAALVATPDFLTSLPEDEVNPLKESFADVKCKPFAAVGHSTLIPNAKYERVDGVRMSKPYSLLAKDMKDGVNYNHWREGKLRGCSCFTAGHWEPAYHQHFDESPTVMLPDGTKWKEFTLELLLWFPWMDDFFRFHQVIVESQRENLSQLVKCTVPTRACAVL
jgi:hypothetical protein